MLFHRLEGTNLGVDIEQFVGDLAEEIDVDAHAGGLAAGRRPPPDHAHAVPLGRTSTSPMQEVVDHVDVPLDVHDLRHLTPAEQDARLAEFLVADRLAGFELDAAPLWRLTLFRLGADARPVRVHVPPLAARHERRRG